MLSFALKQCDKAIKTDKNEYPITNNIVLTILIKTILVYALFDRGVLYCAIRCNVDYFVCAKNTTHTQTKNRTTTTGTRINH